MKAISINNWDNHNTQCSTITINFKNSAHPNRRINQKRTISQRIERIDSEGAYFKRDGM